MRDLSQNIAEREEENGDAVVAIAILMKLVDYMTAVAQNKQMLTLTGEAVPQVWQIAILNICILSVALK